MLKRISRIYRASGLWLVLFIFCEGAACGQSAKGTWDPQFTPPPGLNGPVYAMASTGNDLYVGGAFSKAGGIAANGVAKWDGTNWSTLGSGVAGQVLALAISGTNLYVGGLFHAAGGVGATNVAKWNGTGWEALGGGVDQSFFSTPLVFALYVSGTNLFVGGQFERAGELTAINVARWDGSAWHAMDTGAFLPDEPEPWGNVQAITGDGTNVYVGGVFLQAGSIAATNLACWNETGWHAIGDCTGGPSEVTYQGNTMYGSVSALAMHQGELFVGGSFDYAGGIFAQGIAGWDGATWHNVGNVPGGYVNALESYSGSLYLAGSFTSAGGIATTNAAMWTSGVWSALNTDLHGLDFVASVRHLGSQLYLGGSFSWLQGVSAGNLVQRNGTNWMALGPGRGNSVGGMVSGLATDGTNVYASGYFGTAGTNAVSGLAKWDGMNWSSVGPLPATDGMAVGYSVAVAGSNIYLAGSFTIPEAGATNLAVWDGTAWKSPGGPLTNVFVSELLTVGNVLYASGSFSEVSVSVRQFGPVSGWDGTNWSNVPVGGDSPEDKLATDGTNLYVAQSIFSITNDDYVVQVVRWDGTNLLSLGGSFAGMRASALAVSGTKLYLAGSLTTNNYGPVVYSWDGTSWQSMGAPIANPGFVGAILPLRGNVYVAGSFSSLSGTAVNSIAQWTGTRWLCLDNGIGYGPSSATLGSVFSMVAVGRKVFVGGQFQSAGSLDAGNFAVWNEAPEIRLSHLRKEQIGGFTFDLCGVPGDQLEIQSSGTLSDWVPLGSITLNSEKQAFTDSTVTNANARFYRAKFLR